MAKDTKKVEEAVRKVERKGVVVSDKMDKTVLVAVTRLKKHPKYLKRYNVTKKYKVHDPKNKYNEGDEISFVNCRPISRDKKWKVIY